MSETEFVFVGDHADTLASGRPIAPGDAALPASEIRPEEQPDKDWLAQGLLRPVAVERSELGDVAERTIDDVVTWVGDDVDRRQEALAAEQARGDDARSTLIDKLTKEPS